jgi:sulfatase maturation enzyme AslB (radical SAM superfamily)
LALEIKIINFNGVKQCISPEYNSVFNTKTGMFARWGKTQEDDPKCGPLEIFDLEVSTVCSGIGKGPCKHCYKSNTPKGDNMSFETFKTIFNKLPRTLSQIAFGIGDIWANKDLVKMFDYCRNNDYNPNVVPNVTINGYGLTDEWVQTLAKYCGGVAVSVYDPKDVCYDAVKKLTDAGIAQVNIHMLVSEETLERCHQVIEDVKTDPRLEKLKAVVFLTLKPKGKRNVLHTVKDVSKYRDLINHAFDKKVGIGFDSCTAPMFLAAMKDHPNFETLSNLSESCESNRFSGYANVDGIYWHCSFTEDQPGWSGINLLEAKNFNDDVWNHSEVRRFRSKLLDQDNSHIAKECYMCPVYDLYDPAIKCGCK